MGGNGILRDSYPKWREKRANGTDLRMKSAYGCMNEIREAFVAGAVRHAEKQRRQVAERILHFYFGMLEFFNIPLSGGFQRSKSIKFS